MPIRHRKKQESRALAAWNNKRRTTADPKPVAKPLPKSKGIEPFMHLKGKAVSETLSFRVLGHRDNFDLSGRASLEYADTVVSNILWAVRWVRRNLGSSHALNSRHLRSVRMHAGTHTLLLAHTHCCWHTQLGG